MKFVAVFASLIVISLAGEDTDSVMDDAITQCSAEHKVDISRMTAADEIKKMKKEANFRCFVKCVTVKLEYTDENGDFNAEIVKAKQQLGDAQMRAVQECVAKQKQEDSCERIFEINECLRKSRGHKD